MAHRGDSGSVGLWVSLRNLTVDIVRNNKQQARCDVSKIKGRWAIWLLGMVKQQQNRQLRTEQWNSVIKEKHIPCECWWFHQWKCRSLVWWGSLGQSTHPHWIYPEALGHHKQFGKTVWKQSQEPDPKKWHTCEKLGRGHPTNLWGNTFK